LNVCYVELDVDVPYFRESSSPVSDASRSLYARGHSVSGVSWRVVRSHPRSEGVDGFETHKPSQGAAFKLPMPGYGASYVYCWMTLRKESRLERNAREHELLHSWESGTNRVIQPLGAPR
jgi:hypothetical protein